MLVLLLFMLEISQHTFFGVVDFLSSTDRSEAKICMPWITHGERQTLPASHRDLHIRERAENAARKYIGKGICMNHKSLRAGQKAIFELLCVRHHHSKEKPGIKVFGLFSGLLGRKDKRQEEKKWKEPGKVAWR